MLDGGAETHILCSFWEDGGNLKRGCWNPC
jgi:hypothetical protein